MHIFIFLFSFLLLCARDKSDLRGEDTDEFIFMQRNERTISCNSRTRYGPSEPSIIEKRAQKKINTTTHLKKSTLLQALLKRSTSFFRSLFLIYLFLSIIIYLLFISLSLSLSDDFRKTSNDSLRGVDDGDAYGDKLGSNIFFSFKTDKNPPLVYACIALESNFISLQ